MRRYTYTVAEPVIQLLSSVSRRDRELLIKAFSSLADDPFQPSDGFIKTTGERDVMVKRFRHWLIYFWVNHGDCEVRVVDVEAL